jgi:DNA-binding transcriptional ArsR family regulator
LKGNTLRVSPKNVNVKPADGPEVSQKMQRNQLEFLPEQFAHCIIRAEITPKGPLSKANWSEDETIMTVPAGFKGLRFPCECVSSSPGGYSDPWAEITKHKLLPNGTKEQILNVLAQGPKTVTQIAEALGLSGPSIHTHVSDMLRSELLRDSVTSDKVHPAERYYEPNFPVFKAEECAEFRKLCDEMSMQLVSLFEKNQKKVEQAFLNTSLSQHGWKLSDITQCLFANIQRSARTQLEQRGLLSAREKHKNGAAWIFWAEEPETKIVIRSSRARKAGAKMPRKKSSSKKR